MKKISYLSAIATVTLLSTNLLLTACSSTKTAPKSSTSEQTSQTSSSSSEKVENQHLRMIRKSTLASFKTTKTSSSIVLLTPMTFPISEN